MFFVLVLLVLINGYFAATEIAVVSMDKDEIGEVLGARAKSGLVKKLLDDPPFFFSSVQIGVTLAGFLMSSFSTLGWVAPLGVVLSRIGIPNSGTIAAIIITALVSFVSIIFGELIPKSLAVRYRDYFAPRALVGLATTLYVLYPFVWLLASVQKLVLAFVGVGSLEYSSVVTDEEVLRIVERGRSEGQFLQEEEEMIKSVLEFSDTTVREIMTPRLAVFWLDKRTSVEDALKLMLDSGYSRALLCDETLDNVLGVVHIKDLMRLQVQGNMGQDLISIRRDVLFVPETEMINEVFFQMRRLRNHLAVVVDEYGAVAGVVSLEDILEELVGEIRDEYDQEEEPIRIVEKSDDYVKAVVLGQVSLGDVNDALDLNLEAEEVDTIAGFILLQLQHFPEVGEKLKIDGTKFTVLSVTNKRIDKVLIEREVSEEDQLS
ncbi:hemolysin family protein [Coprothermobacter platensis]|uniref:hemolysin family protein n=1 Tax=Coprothermobacter platensis TaxID=108819 RepID=UPI000363B8DB|nr:hemolysin family protein [Coprothermobacter platensis]